MLIIYCVAFLLKQVIRQPVRLSQFSDIPILTMSRVFLELQTRLPGHPVCISTMNVQVLTVTGAALRWGHAWQRLLPQAPPHQEKGLLFLLVIRQHDFSFSPDAAFISYS